MLMAIKTEFIEKRPSIKRKINYREKVFPANIILLKVLNINVFY